ncbi:MAG: choice-of-anchor I family protein [Bacteroidales bacterium]
MNKFKIAISMILFLITGKVSFSQTLIHYWNFNNSATLTELLAPSTSLISGAAITHVTGGISAIQISSNTGQGFDVTNPNARNSDISGTHLRFNDPIGGGLIFSAPTTGFYNIILKYGTRRSSSGAGTQLVAYTIDGSTFIPFDTIFPVNGNPEEKTLDFSFIPEANNNPEFKIRFFFEQGTGGTVGNNRFDNFTVEGSDLSGDITPPAVAFYPLSGSINLSVQVQPTLTFSEEIRMIDNSVITDLNVDNLIEFLSDNGLGTQIPFDATISGTTITITPSGPLQNNQLYYLALKPDMVEDFNNNAVSILWSATFTTLSNQTVFQPGDLVPVAYRMNATATEDEIAILTLVDIMPGTMINFTDGKYTSNTVPQCSGGFIWQSPAASVSAGTVISIQTSALTASVGSLTGSGFGLSSGGDQVIIYTGTPAVPNYITALSSNAWVASNSSCSGSLSQLPAGLTDGVSSINLSTAPANVSGLTVNAYYNGIMAGTNAQLKNSILNPANWVGAGGATPPQTWPVWAFPGPPSVVNAAVINSTTLRIIFNADLDPVSAADLLNYSGISGLLAAMPTVNGTLADTVILSFSSAFVSGTSYSLSISGVKDSEDRMMVGSFPYTFAYNASIAWNKKFYTINENAGSIQVQLDLSFPSLSSVDLVVKPAPFSTAAAEDFTLVNQTLNFSGSSTTTQVITIPIIDDAISEDDEYLVISLENINGVNLSGSKYVTVYIKDNDRHVPTPDQELKLSYVSSFDPSPVTGSTTEIVAYDPTSKRLFMTSAIQDRLDIADFSNPAAISLVTSVDMAPYGGITSVAVKNGIVAATSPNANEQLDGSVVFFNTDGVFLNQVTVGALPDMITFTPDGNRVLTANEGQPNDAYTVDPEGSVSIVDISGGIAGLSQANVNTLFFTDFNSQESALVSSGVRKLKVSNTLSQDFEPEYISINSDGTKAWVTLQENNAIAEINLQNNSITDVWALGMKDYSLTGNGFDASDKSGTALLSNFNVKAFYIPDGIANINVNGTNYIFTANEGDEKEYSGLNERTTVGAASTILDPTIYPNAAVVKEDHALGRLRITNRNGDTDGDGDYDQLCVVGARSFSIFNADTKSLVFDSGNDFESFISTSSLTSSIFNCDNADNVFKGRSRAKGPEPEGIIVREINGKKYAFIALERIGGVMIYNVTNPTHPVFVDYNNSRNLTTYGGDNGPEGIELVDASSSPDGRYYIIVANEISGTISTYQLDIAGEAGPSTAVAPYLSPIGADREFTSVLTVPETVNNYKMVGIPDGLGAFDNGDNTFTLLMNHEIGNTLGVTRAHGSTGAFVSKWIINKSDLTIVSGSDLVQNVNLWNESSYTTYNAANPSPLAAFNRLCSADLPAVSAFYNNASGLGTQERIFMNGEESGSEGRAFAHIATGPNTGTTYELPWLGKFSWENSVASPVASDKTVVAGLDDVTGGQVYFYIGTKTNSGNEIDKAGLSNGKLFGVAVSGLATEISASYPAPATPFTLVDLGYVNGITGAALQTASVNAGVTSFLRPEDGAWDPSSPNDFYFVTTNAFTSPSRLWKLHFTDAANPELGGTITAVLDGTEGPKMMDNLTIDKYGHILIQEDPGNQEYLAKIWQYTIANDQIELAAEHKSSLFSTGAPAFLTKDEESSGILDMENILGPGKFILTVQAHFAIPGEAVEGGQLLAFFNPDTYNSYTDAHTFAGTVVYDNSLSTPMSNSVIKLKQGSSVIHETTTGGSGEFSFTTLNEGNYVVEIATHVNWGGVNATDAQLIIKQFTGSANLLVFRQKAGDVNVSSYLNSADALLLAKRFTGLVNSFASGDWLFGRTTLVIDGMHSPSGTIKSLCFGDVDGSYSFGLKTEPSVNLQENGLIAYETGKQFEIPVTVSADIAPGAFSIALTLPSSNLLISDVVTALPGTLVFNRIGDEIRVAWYTDQFVNLRSGDILFTIKAIVRENNEIQHHNWSINSESTISDANAEILNDVKIAAPALIKSKGFYLGQNIPNPSSGNTIIEYLLPEEGQVALKVFNLLGELVLAPLNQFQSEGSHSISIEVSDLPTGIYQYQLELNGNNIQSILSKKMIINN